MEVKNKKVKHYYHPVGFKEYPKRELKCDSEGLHYIGFVIDSETKKPIMDDWYSDIQKSEKSCCVRTLFENAVKNDNMDLLKIRQKVSADLTGLPDNLLDMLNSFKSVESYFESLPVDVKKDFNNNAFEFVKRQGKFSDSFIANSKARRDLLNLQLGNENKKEEKNITEKDGN